MYPIEEQRAHIQKIIWATNWTYNWALDVLAVHPGTSKFGLTKMFTRYKHDNPQIVNMVEYVYHMHAIWNAYEAARRAKKDRGTARYRTYRSTTFGSDFKPRIKGDSTVILAGLRDVHTSGLKCIENPRSYTVIDRTPDRPLGRKQFLLLICCRREERARQAGDTAATEIRGIDIGVTKPMTVSSVSSGVGAITSQEWYDTTAGYGRMMSQINYLKKKMSKMIRGSRRHQRTRRKLRMLWISLSNTRRHAERILAKQIVSGNTREIIMERLSVKGMTKRGGNYKTGFNRRFRFARTYHTRQAIRRACEKQNVRVTEVNPRYTSQRCFACGHTDRENRHGSEFLCRRCGHIADADANASANIALASDFLVKSRVSGGLVSSLVRRELDSTGRFFSPASVPVRECRTHGRVGFPSMQTKGREGGEGEKRRKAKGAYPLQNG